jgi:uncharacterized tellurite resistance protein B-like protein
VTVSIFDWLGLGAARAAEGASDGSSAVRDIVDQLSSLDPEQARWVASFAMVLARAARADLDISDQELEAMKDIVHRIGGLPLGQAALVAEMAAHRNQLLGASEDYLATREFNRVAADGDRERLLHCLFAVTAADDSISLVEEEEVRQVANELGIEHSRFTEIRASFRDQREVLRGLPGGGKS